MRWQGRERSENVQDIRGSSGRRLATPQMGCGGIVITIVIILIAMYNGADPRPLLDMVGQMQPEVAAEPDPNAAIDDEAREFIEVVLKDTENVWSDLFDRQVRGARYQPPPLVMFSGQVNTACGRASAATGPFYCPADQTVYIDPTFFDEMARRLKAPGDFAQAYVIAHEVGHHVQEQLGFSDFINRARRSRNQLQINKASVRYELQADFLAGVWAHHAQKRYQIMESGDLREALNAANQIGDDTLQKMSGGFVIPERFTHGTSEQRVRWFHEGFQSGDLNRAKELFTVPESRL